MANLRWRSANQEQVEAGQLIAKWSADGTRILRYYIDFRHRALALHKDLSAPDLAILQSKTDALMEQWDRKYDDLIRKSNIINGRTSAEAASLEAQQRITSLSQILARTLAVDDRVDWESLKVHSEYKLQRFGEPKPRRTRATSPVFVEPKVSWIDVLFGQRSKKQAVAKRVYDEAVLAWVEEERNEDNRLAKLVAQWDERRHAHDASELASKEEFDRTKVETNQSIDELRSMVSVGEPNAIIEQVSIVLEASDYDGLFEKDFEVDYDRDSRTVFVDYGLPSPSDMPTVKAVKFVASTGEITESHLSERDQKANYDSACFQVALRTIHEVLEADVDGNIDRVSFNGFASSIDRSTGQDVRPCIMSALVKKEEFKTFDLSRVDPKACFKSLKGVSASSLAALAPVAPVMAMNRADKRFVDGRDVVGQIGESTNLASMSWEDFEHLVRQLFEKEFQVRGGEVRITQASRDGGVDAVAFDPDPIRGGKIVIQAKRYTRTVSVSAVRDLYGTLMNEGASRGILVTTADYGPDAYAFANGKPLTLISGSNLLHMLGQHGYQAKIDIAEARTLLGALPAEGY